MLNTANIRHALQTIICDSDPYSCPHMIWYIC